MSVQPTRLVAALDLGSTKVAAVIAEVQGDQRSGSTRVLGVGVERCHGVRRGVVRGIEETTRAIAKAMKDAERMAGVENEVELEGVAVIAVGAEQHPAQRHASGRRGAVALALFRGGADAAPA